MKIAHVMVLNLANKTVRRIWIVPPNATSTKINMHGNWHNHHGCGLSARLQSTVNQTKVKLIKGSLVNTPSKREAITLFNVRCAKGVAAFNAEEGRTFKRVQRKEV